MWQKKAAIANILAQLVLEHAKGGPAGYMAVAVLPILTWPLFWGIVDLIINPSGFNLERDFVSWVFFDRGNRAMDPSHFGMVATDINAGLPLKQWEVHAIPDYDKFWRLLAAYVPDNIPIDQLPKEHEDLEYGILRFLWFDEKISLSPTVNSLCELVRIGKVSPSKGVPLSKAVLLLMWLVSGRTISLTMKTNISACKQWSEADAKKILAREYIDTTGDIKSRLV